MNKWGWASALLFLVLSHSVAAQAVREVDAVGITVEDLDRALEFYTGVLGFERVGAEEEVAGESYERLLGVFGLRLRAARLRLGEEEIELLEYLTPRGRPMPADARSNDRYFQHIAIIVSDMDQAYARLRQHHVRHASSGPQTLPAWNKNAGGIKAFYFKDGDDNVLEILQFPPGKGDPKWQRLAAANPGRLFLGIDHTAIVSSDTEASLRFYRDLLGLTIAGGAENWGTEQEHLNNVFGAHLRITTLKAAHGPGVELLEYLAPQGGRPYPPDSRANDGWFWQTHLETADLAATAQALRAAGYELLSEPTSLAAPFLGARAGFLARDPDLHALFVYSRGPLN